jgi:protein-tyrosine phosphatase
VDQKVTNDYAIGGAPGKIVLFLCTGNYYRSRFAELLFNHLARQNQLGWLAISRALAIELCAGNIGPISKHTVEALVERGIPLRENFRYPIVLEEGDLVVASQIVAVKRDEHLPLLKLKFPRWAERVEFWHVHDTNCARPREALAQIDQNVRRLIQRLRTGAAIAERDGTRRLDQAS